MKAGGVLMIQASEADQDPAVTTLTADFSVKVVEIYPDWLFFNGPPQ